MAQYARYWSCSKFADWLRGTEKGSSKTGREWREWRKSSQETNPIRYWLAEEGLDHIQDFVYWPYNKLCDIRYYINNRWVTKAHAMTANKRDIKPGKWCDVGYRFLPCMFNELVDFVEIEQAWNHVIWNDEAQREFKTPWWRKSIFRLRAWRCPAAGLAYLDWASKLVLDESWGVNSTDEDYGKLTNQALSAIEIKELYHWWTEIYPNRPDPYDTSGWTKICSRTREDGDILSIFDHENETQEIKDERNASHTKLKDIEEAYAKEEEEMMIRLLKIRGSLWT